MALIEYDVYKQKLRDLEPELKKLGDALDIDAVAQEAARLEDETTQDGFWNNLERSQKVQTRLKQLQNKLHRFKKLMSTWEDLTTLCEMGQEAEDEGILEELKTEFPALETEIEEIRMTTLLSGEYDANNVILQLHSGAGGTEAQDCNLFIPNYFESLGYTLEQASYSAAAVMAGVTVGKLLLGHINDRNTLFGVLLSTLGGALGLVALVVGGRPGPGAVRLRVVRPGLFGRDGADGHAHAQGVRPGALRPHLLDGVDSACSRRRLGVRWLGTAPGGYLLHLHHGCGSRRTGHLRHPRRRRPEGPERRRLTFNKC